MDVNPLRIFILCQELSHSHPHEWSFQCVRRIGEGRESRGRVLRYMGKGTVSAMFSYSLKKSKVTFASMET